MKEGAMQDEEKNTVIRINNQQNVCGIPGYGSEYNQVGFLLIVPNDGILHVTVWTDRERKSDMISD